MKKGSPLVGLQRVRATLVGCKGKVLSALLDPQLFLKSANLSREKKLEDQVLYYFTILWFPIRPPHDLAHVGQFGCQFGKIQFNQSNFI